jgi:hypothetical protein
MGEYPLKTNMEFQVKNLWQYLWEETLGTCFPHCTYILICVFQNFGKIWASPTHFYSFNCGFWLNMHCAHPIKRKQTQLSSTFICVNRPVYHPTWRFIILTSIPKPCGHDSYHLGLVTLGTLSVKFEIYMCQTIIFGGILDNCPTYFLSLYYYLII